MSEFADAFPDVDLQIAPDVTDRPVEALKDGTLDLAILETESDDPDLDQEDLFEDELLLAMCTDHPLVQEPYLTARHLWRMRSS